MKRVQLFALTITFFTLPGLTGVGCKSGDPSSQLPVVDTIQAPLLDPAQAFPGPGNYSGIRSGTFSANSVCFGKTYFGTPGLAACQTEYLSDPASAPDVVGGKDYWDSNGMKQTGTLAYRGAYDARTAFGAGGYISGVTHLPSANELASGVQALGVTGTAVTQSANSYIPSQIHRDKSSPRLSLAEEVNHGSCNLPSYVTRSTCEAAGGQWTPTPLGAGYHAIPKIALDDEGYTGENVAFAPRPGKVCGVGIGNIQDRISDCATQNGSAATWEGPSQGNAGFSSWTLVTVIKEGAANGTECGGSCFEVWRDDRTGFIWSDAYGSYSSGAFSWSDENWCLAAGSSNSSNVIAQYREVDPYVQPFCSSDSYQSQMTPLSWCFESSGFGRPSDFDISKGKMVRNATAQTPSVLWRLPSMYDYKQAEIDGIRFVLPNVLNTFWTATVLSPNRRNAWGFHGGLGRFDFHDRASPGLFYGIRCIGR